MANNHPPRRVDKILSLKEIEDFHPAFRPHFMAALNDDPRPFRVNVFFNESSKFVVVAPHGYRKDDRNTDILAHALAAKLQASALINSTKYRKPKFGHDPEIQSLSVSNPVRPSRAELAVRAELVRRTDAIPVDLNIWPDAMLAAPDFFHPLLSIAEKLRRICSPLVIFVHGIADHNASGHPNPDFVVAAGYEYTDRNQALQNGCSTASGEVVDHIVSGLEELRHNGRKLRIEEGMPGYAAANPIRMPWVFKTAFEGTDGPLNLYAIQLEVRHHGFRDVSNIPSTAAKLASVFLGLNNYLCNFKPVRSGK